nr:replication initiator protein A [Bradyrhizobium erythrophlei]
MHHYADGSAEHGLATVFDCDVFLNMMSYLAEETRRYRISQMLVTIAAPCWRAASSQASDVGPLCTGSASVKASCRDAKT